MKIMIIISLLLNIAVLVPVTYGIATAAPWADEAYGAASAARGIVLAVYCAILLASVILLFKPVVAAVAALLAIQIVYKLLTPLTVGTLDNPVVQSNLFIAAVHAVTLAVIAFRSAQ